MGKLSSFFSKIPFLSGLGGKKKSAKSNVELQYDKAINLMENGNAEDAVEIFEKIVDIAIMDPNYKNFGTDALKISLMALDLHPGDEGSCMRPESIATVLSMWI